MIRRSSGWLLTGILAIGIPGVLGAQGSTDGPERATPLQPGSMPQTADANKVPVQPGKLLSDTISAPPLTGEEKFHDRVASVFGVRGFLGSAVGAGIGTGMSVPKEWDTHIGGYGLRYISGFGQNLTHQAFAFGLDYALHEDPRYFPSEQHGFKPRLLNVLKQSVISRRDDGSEGPAYSRLISDFAAAQVGGAWQPPSNQGFANGLERGVIMLGAESAINLIQEFVPFARPASIRHRH